MSLTVYTVKTGVHTADTQLVQNVLKVYWHLPRKEYILINRTCIEDVVGYSHSKIRKKNVHTHTHTYMLCWQDKDLTKLKFYLKSIPDYLE